MGPLPGNDEMPVNSASATWPDSVTVRTFRKATIWFERGMIAQTRRDGILVQCWRNLARAVSEARPCRYVIWALPHQRSKGRACVFYHLHIFKGKRAFYPVRGIPLVTLAQIRV